MIKKDGLTAPSKKPKTNRMAPMLLKACEAARHISAAPHNTLGSAIPFSRCWKTGLSYNIHSYSDKQSNADSAHKVSCRVLRNKLAEIEKRHGPRKF